MYRRILTSCASAVFVLKVCAHRKREAPCETVDGCSRYVSDANGETDRSVPRQVSLGIRAAFFSGLYFSLSLSVYANFLANRWGLYMDECFSETVVGRSNWVVWKWFALAVVTYVLVLIFFFFFV